TRSKRDCSSDVCSSDLGHFFLRPAVDVLRQDLLQLVGPVCGDLLFIRGGHAGGPGTEQQGLAGGHLLSGGEGGGAGTLHDAQARSEERRVGNKSERLSG